MFDSPLRSVKDTFFFPILPAIPSVVHPLHLTLLAFVVGLASCWLAILSRPLPSAGLFLLNRILDCLDGAVARERGLQSELGGFLDLLGDFIVYSLVPISIASALGVTGESINSGRGGGEAVVVWAAVAVLEASFYLNNFVLFYSAAITEKLRHRGPPSTKPAPPNRHPQNGNGHTTSPKEQVYSEMEEGRRQQPKQLTSLTMKPALIEGFESGLLFTLMLAFPDYLTPLAWGMAVCVGVGTVQRVLWLTNLLAISEAR